MSSFLSMFRKNNNNEPTKKLKKNITSILKDKDVKNRNISSTINTITRNLRTVNTKSINSIAKMINEKEILLNAIKQKRINFITELLSNNDLAKLIINGTNKGMSPLITLLETDYHYSNEKKELLTLFLSIPTININYSYKPITFNLKFKPKSALIIACNNNLKDIVEMLLDKPEIKRDECLLYLKKEQKEQGINMLNKIGSMIELLENYKPPTISLEPVSTNQNDVRKMNIKPNNNETNSRLSNNTYPYQNNGTNQKNKNYKKNNGKNSEINKNNLPVRSTNNNNNNKINLTPMNKNK